MKRFSFIICLVLAVFPTLKAQETSMLDPMVQMPDSVRRRAVCDAYLAALQQLKSLRDEQRLVTAAPVPDAYSFQLLSNPTLYTGPLRQMMTVGDETARDQQLQRLNYVNRALAQFYVQTPWMVTQTEDELKQSGTLRAEEEHQLSDVGNLADKIAPAEVHPEVEEEVKVITRRPNFWKTSGYGKAHFQQNYVTENWFQGGMNNYAGTFTIHLEAHYNDQKKITWDHVLDAQLGFQTNPNDKARTFSPTANSLRYNTSFGHKAYKKIYYTISGQLSTSIVRVYAANTDNLVSAFASPLDVTIGPGLTYSNTWGKKRPFSVSVNLNPLAYNMRFVGRDELIKNYGVCKSDDHGQHPADGSECNHSTHQFGPNVNVSTSFTPMKNVKWTSRLFWFSNFSMTKIEWEHTINFTINKYISSTFYFYPRYEDSSPRYRHPDSNTYWMFKEWLSLGLTYNF